MRKKFIRVMFFGALALATGASFVGCKDYDDDIDALNTRVDEITNTLSALQQQIGSYVKSVTYDEATGELTVVDGGGTSHTYTLSQDMPEYTLEVADNQLMLKKDGETVSTIDLPAAPAEFDPSLLSVGEDGYLYYGETKTEVFLGAQGIVAITNEEGDIIGYTITTIENGTPTSASFYIIDAVPLKGLVFKPECLVNGVPSLKAANITYNEWTAAAYTAPTATGETFVISDKASYITPQIWAYYHMNPSSVSKEQIEAMGFISEDVDNYTRSAAMNPTADLEKSEVTEDRLLKVAMNADAEKIPALGDDQMAIYALQVTTKAVAEGKEAAVITSDYASIYKVGMEDFVLKYVVDPKAETKTYNTLYGQSIARNGKSNRNAGKAQEAIKAKADLQVSSDNTLDVAAQIVTFYKENGTGEEKLIANDKLADYGLKYRFAASNYLGGDNADTEQNTFINTSDAEKGVINPEYKEAESPNTIGREPLLRVELVDVATDKVVAVGWIKTQIVKGEIAGFEVTFDKGTYFYGCEDFEKSLTYIDMNDVYDQAGLSKEEFHTAYTLKLSGSNAALAEGSTGIVTPVPSTGGTQTDVVTWTVTPAEALAIGDGKQMFATITYESTDGTRADINIKLTATVDIPEGAVDNSGKITEAWFENYAYVKADVNEPVSTKANSFTIDLFNVFEGKKVAISGVDEANFPDFEAADLKTAFIFAAEQDEVKIGDDTYTFQVSSNGRTLQAQLNGAGAWQTVATINTNGVITYNRASNATYAKTLLNKSAYNEDPLSIGIEIVATNGCDETLPLTNNTFDVKFLRPINAYDKEVAELTDATTGTATIDMSELMGLTDWRGEEFEVSPVNFYNYYGISGIAIDKANIMTTLNASEAEPKKLSEVAPDMNISYSYDSSDLPNLGDVVYANNDHTFHTPFKLYIPVTVTYTFGTVQTTVTLTINPTVGNN